MAPTSSRTAQARRRTAALLVASSLLVSLVAGCSKNSTSTTAARSTTTAATSTTAAPKGAGHRCDRRPEAAPKVTSVPEVATDRTMTSFDGTEIRFHWFPTDKTVDGKAPVVLMGPGWGQPGDTSTKGLPLFGALGIPSLNEHGYNVLTWDPRGFGASTGKAEIDAAATEGRDVERLLDWTAEQPEVLLDAKGDPRSGMVGFSYGGGIQLVTAAVDCRIDAIVPGIAWNSLETSLYKGGIAKIGWAQFLLRVAPAGRLAPQIVSAADHGLVDGTVPESDVDWFRSRGPGEAVRDVKVPTLILQGTVDTLFTLDEAVANHRLLDEAGTTVSMIWFCGGHGACLTYDANDDTTWLSDATFAWLDKYVKGNATVDPGARFRFVDQDGTHWQADRYPDATTADGAPAVRATGTGTLDLTAEGGAGPVTTKPASKDILSGAVTGITPAKASHAVDVKITAAEAGMVLGAGSLTLTYSGSTPAGDRPTRVFAQLVDDATGLVVGNQITPVPVVLDGAEHKVTVPLETVAQRVAAGDTLTLQIVATTVAYAQPRLGGKIELSDISVAYPLVTSGLRRSAGSDL